jgi:hypothetical protein
MSLPVSHHRRRSRLRKIAAAAATIFALTQPAFLVHEAHHLVHKDGKVCEICVHASHIGDAIPMALSLPVAPHADFTEWKCVEKAVVARFVPRFSIRAPPTILS